MKTFNEDLFLSVLGWHGSDLADVVNLEIDQIR